MSSVALQWFEIGIENHSNKQKVSRNKNAFMSTGQDLPFNAYGKEAGWRFRKIDLKPQPEMRTIFRQAKDHKTAMRIAKRLGSVIFCQKVDASFHFKKIEYLKLNQKPYAIEIKRDDQYVLNAEGELTLSQQGTKDMLEQKYEIDIDFSK